MTASPTSPVGSAYLADLFDVGTDTVNRWHRNGWLRPVRAPNGSGSRALWPLWSVRMAALIVAEGGASDGTSVSGSRHRRPADVLRFVAWALEAHPTAVWVVIVDDDSVLVSLAEELPADVLGSGWLAPVIVSPPALESVL